MSPKKTPPEPLVLCYCFAAVAKTIALAALCESYESTEEAMPAIQNLVAEGLKEAKDHYASLPLEKKVNVINHFASSLNMEVDWSDVEP